MEPFDRASDVITGRWMAYDSDESGQGVDVFIQSFPDPKLKRLKVSPAHGSEPMWTQAGRELVYREGDKVMAVSIDLATGATGRACCSRDRTQTIPDGPARAATTSPKMANAFFSPSCLASSRGHASWWYSIGSTSCAPKSRVEAR
jgi:hypothetical protein